MGQEIIEKIFFEISEKNFMKPKKSPTKVSSGLEKRRSEERALYASQSNLVATRIALDSAKESQKVQ